MFCLLFYCLSIPVVMSIFCIEISAFDPAWKALIKGVGFDETGGLKKFDWVRAYPMAALDVPGLGKLKPAVWVVAYTTSFFMVFFSSELSILLSVIWIELVFG